MKILLILLLLNNLLIFPQDFWLKTNFPDTIIVNAIEIEKSTNTAFAGTYNGVYKSTDQGNNWTEINDGISGRRIINHFLILDSLNIYASTFDGLFKTTDGGQNWNFIQIGSGSIYCRLLQKSKEGDFFLCTEGGIYRSLDNGESWEKIFFTGDNIVFTATIDSKNIFSHIGSMLYKSGDYGNSWKMKYEFYLPDSNGTVVYGLNSSLLVEKDKILFGAYGGVFYTPDGGSTFIHKSNGIGIKSIDDLLMDEDDHIFAVSTTDDNVFLTLDYSSNWTSYSSGLQNSMPTSISSDKFGYLYLGTLYGGIYKSIASTSKFLPDKRVINFYSNLNTFYSDSILIKNNSDSTLVISDIYITDSDYSVTPQNLSLNAGDSINIIISYYPVENNLDTARIIFKNNSFLQTEIIWLNGYAGIPVLETPFLTLNFSDVGIGETKDTVVCLRNVGVDTLFIDSLIIDNSSFGIEYNSSYILPFDTLSINLFFSPTSLYQHEAYLTMHSNNYSSPDSILLRGWGTNPVNIQTENINHLSFELFQNYPNPFNPLTNIRFNIPSVSKVRLEVYNVLGERINLLVNSELQAGEHTIVFNGSKLSSGVYFYKLSAGNFVSIKKLMLMK